MKKSNNKNIIMTLVALLLIFSLTVGFTYSWIEGGNKAYINSNEITITTGSNLTIRDNDGIPTTELTFPVSDLYEVSSADGRSFFIPTNDNTTNAQASMTFRTGTPFDENTKYISLDFQIEAGDSTTSVYIGSGTVVRCADAEINKALRMAFYENDGSSPKVFMPSQMPGVDNITYNPIVAIDNNGKVLADVGTDEVETVAYGKYYFKGTGKDQSGNDRSTPIFNLEAYEVLNVTMVLWLEGTEIINEISETEINVNIEFTTNSDDLVEYTFVDNTHGFSHGKTEYWVTKTQEDGTSKYETMMYLYDKVNDKYYAMFKSDNYDNNHEWNVYVPSKVSNFTFRRYSIDLDRCWNEWVPDMRKAVDGSTYIAICGKRNSNASEGWEANVGPCGGYWQDAKNTIRVFFEIKTATGWGDPKCYAWTSVNSHPLGYAGKTMTYSHSVYETQNNKQVEVAKIFFIDISISDGSVIHGIEFRNSNSDNVKLSFKNEKLGTEYFFNGFAAWYGNTSNTGEYIYQKHDITEKNPNEECGAYVYQGAMNNPLWQSSTIYADDYDSDTYNWDYHYMYFHDANRNPVGASWPGYAMYLDSATNKFKISIITDEEIYVILNNMGEGNQYPSSGSKGLAVQPGKSYYLTNTQKFYEYYP